MTSDSPIRPPERLSSGIAGLDTILNGGFLQSGIYIIRGKPGGGKTILGNQIAFTHVAHGGRALYVTLLAESHARMFQHLSGLRYFDAARVPTALSYISGFRELEENGLKGLLTLIRREITRMRATVVVLDGFVSAGEKAPSATEFKKFIHELQTVASLSNSTMFLLTSSVNEPVTPEQTMVDGIIQLHDDIMSAQAMRTLEVPKFRGSPALRGPHMFRITKQGIVVYPRLEALHGMPSGSAQWHPERLSTGIAGLDEAIGGGIPRASSTILFGASGSGKTSVSLQFLAAGDEPGLLFGFYEPPERLKGKARSLGLDLDRRIDNGQVRLMWNPTTETLLDELGHQLLDAVREHGVKRLAIDGLGGFEVANQQPGRLTRFFSALANELRVLDVTTCITIEARDLVNPALTLPMSNISSVAENMIVLRVIEWRSQIRRVLSVFKIRDSEHDPRMRELLMTSNGVHLGSSFEAAEELLTGTAISSPQSSPAKG